MADLQGVTKLQCKVEAREMAQVKRANISCRELELGSQYQAAHNLL